MRVISALAMPVRRLPSRQLRIGANLTAAILDDEDFHGDIFQNLHSGQTCQRGRRAASALAIHSRPGGRKVHPDLLGSFCGHARSDFGIWWQPNRVNCTKAPGASARKGVADWGFSSCQHRPVTSGRPETTAEAGASSAFLERSHREPVGVALHDFGMGIAIAQQCAETRIIFDQYETLLIHPMLDQRVGDRTGPGPKFDDGTFRLSVDILRHGPASTRLEGITVPICSGFSIHDRENEPRRRDEEVFSKHAPTIAMVSLPVTA